METNFVKQECYFSFEHFPMILKKTVFIWTMFLIEVSFQKSKYCVWNDRTFQRELENFFICWKHQTAHFWNSNSCIAEIFSLQVKTGLKRLRTSEFYPWKRSVKLFLSPKILPTHKPSIFVHKKFARNCVKHCMFG